MKVRVGDLYLSLSHTAQLCGSNPFDYLVSLQRNAEAAAASPGDWMPWSYAQARDHLELSDPQPAALDP